jgi:head-tail adaptor
MSKPRGAGDLRQKVYFERRGEGSDGYGNPVQGWEPLGISRSASLHPTRGGEAVQADRFSGRVQWDCWVRSDSGTRSLQTGDRMVDERDPSRTFNIGFIGDMDGGRVWLLIQAVSGGADG